MTSRRFPPVELTEWRSRLVDQHPRLFPDARPFRDSDGWALTCPGYPNIPDGWRRILERACERLDQAVAAEPLAEAVILDVKEKYGTMRLSVSSVGLSAKAQAAVALAVDLAEARSSHVCGHCGALGRLWSRGGWLATCCDQHGEGVPVEVESGQDVEVTTRFLDGQPVRTARRYVLAQDRFVHVPVPKEV